MPIAVLAKALLTKAPENVQDYGRMAEAR